MTEKDPEARQLHLDEELARDLRGLAEAGLEPKRDLWPELERELRLPRRISLRELAIAASLLLLLGASAWWLSGPRSRFSAATLLTERSSSDLPSESSAELRAAFASYWSERQELLDAVTRALGSYPPEVRQEVQQSLLVMERAMKEIETSIGQVPAEPADEMRLAELYDLELRLLGRVSARLADSATSPMAERSLEEGANR